ncbi:hypothetical protein HX014_09990 [Myroides marinus]|uniref:hypothetical protein n=1 Tax=Myroides marinus TaxID=703342 RepID=UPI0025785F01|nr:hypothetical protein [Myroides marinus]MDM1350933.1 hypothetical protein [Myroides marinus]MDM1358140.1 hypothetical protein [Myroides marinus]
MEQIKKSGYLNKTQESFVRSNISYINADNSGRNTPTAEYFKEVDRLFGSVMSMRKMMQEEFKLLIENKYRFESLVNSINNIERLNSYLILETANHYYILVNDLTSFINKRILRKAINLSDSKSLNQNISSLLGEVLTPKEAAYLKSSLQYKIQNALSLLFIDGFSDVNYQFKDDINQENLYTKNHQVDVFNNHKREAALHFFIARVILLGYKTKIIDENEKWYNLEITKNGITKKVLVTNTVESSRDLYSNNFLTHSFRYSNQRNASHFDFFVLVDIDYSTCYIAPMIEVDDYFRKTPSVRNFKSHAYRKYFETWHKLHECF